jgi:hypothetical protein
VLRFSGARDARDSDADFPFGPDPLPHFLTPPFLDHPGPSVQPGPGADSLTENRGPDRGARPWAPRRSGPRRAQRPGPSFPQSAYLRRWPWTSDNRAPSRRFSDFQRVGPAYAEHFRPLLLNQSVQPPTLVQTHRSQSEDLWTDAFEVSGIRWGASPASLSAAGPSRSERNRGTGPTRIEDFGRHRRRPDSIGLAQRSAAPCHPPTSLEAGPSCPAGPAASFSIGDGIDLWGGPGGRSLRCRAERWSRACRSPLVR